MDALALAKTHLTILYTLAIVTKDVFLSLSL